MDKKYTKIIVAKYSPQNSCYASDGDVLILKPKPSIPMKNLVTHHFVSAQNNKTKSKYGWVKEVDEFTLSEYIERYATPAKLNEKEMEHIMTMLRSVDKLPVDTPVAADYSKYGVMEHRMVLTVHKVIFYHDNKE